jgi:hypothetical protein
MEIKLKIKIQLPENITGSPELNEDTVIEAFIKDGYIVIETVEPDELPESTDTEEADCPPDENCEDCEFCCPFCGKCMLHD